MDRGINPQEDRLLVWTRRIARLIGALASVYWVLTLVVSGLAGSEPITLLGVLLAGLVAVNVFGLFLAWRRAKPGITVLLVGAVSLSGFAYVTAGHNEWIAVLMTGGPFLLSGILFWCAALLRHRQLSQ